MLSHRTQLRCALSRWQLLVSPHSAFELINTRVSTNTHTPLLCNFSVHDFALTSTHTHARRPYTHTHTYTHELITRITPRRYTLILRFTTNRKNNYNNNSPLTSSITLRGVFSLATMSFNESAPITLVPLASLFRKSLTFETVRL